MAVLGRSGCGGSEVSGLGEKEDYGGLQTPKTETPIPFERVFDVMKRSDTVKELPARKDRCTTAAVLLTTPGL